MYIKVLETEENIFPFTDFNETHLEMSEQNLAELGIYKVTLVDTVKASNKYYGLGVPYLSEGLWKVEEVEEGSLEVNKERLESAIRKERDKRIEAESWRYERYARNQRLSLPQTDSIEALDTYIQNLADLPNQEEFPLLVTWPTLSE